MKVSNILLILLILLCIVFVSSGALAKDGENYTITDPFYLDLKIIPDIIIFSGFDKNTRKTFDITAEVRTNHKFGYAVYISQCQVLNCESLSKDMQLNDNYLEERGLLMSLIKPSINNLSAESQYEKITSFSKLVYASGSSFEINSPQNLVIRLREPENSISLFDEIHPILITALPQI